MTHKTRNLLLASLFLLSTNTFADENNFTYSASIVGMNMDYKEYSTTGNLLDSEASQFTDIGGFEVGLDYLFSQEENSYSKINSSVLYVRGNSAYVGSLLGSNKPYGSSTSTTLNDIADISIAYDIYHPISNKFTYNYGLGLGYRYWRRALSASQVETYQWLSLRPNIGMSMKINSDFKTSVDVSYQYGIKPTMYASDISSTFTLGSANIIELDLGLRYRFNEKMDFFTDYVLQKQTIGQSDNVVYGSNTYYEPDSTAYNQYLKLGVSFKY